MGPSPSKSRLLGSTGSELEGILSRRVRGKLGDSAITVDYDCRGRVPPAYQRALVASLAIQASSSTPDNAMSITGALWPGTWSTGTRSAPSTSSARRSLAHRSQRRDFSRPSVAVHGPVLPHGMSKHLRQRASVHGRRDLIIIARGGTKSRRSQHCTGSPKKPYERHADGNGAGRFQASWLLLKTTSTGLT
ncbi:hypothetical protein ON010_g9334 [Phytophthora cinnamomi]|nr:hypothetical protein ON010_g9334 [Phytophthora cinnamomi]